MDPAFHLHPGQEALTPEQEGEARRFAHERIAAAHSTAPVSEPDAEQFLRQAYAQVGLPLPHRICWLNGPLQLVAVLAPQVVRANIRASVGASMEGIPGEHVWPRVLRDVTSSVSNQVRASVGYEVLRKVNWRVQGSVRIGVWAHVGAVVAAGVAAEVDNLVNPVVWTSATGGIGRRVGASVRTSVMAGVAAFYEASWLAYFHYFDTYLAPNPVRAFAQFNALVSGAWLGPETAYVVRRPRRLDLDAAGRLHSDAGMCVEYPDGWGCYAWHGVRVPEHVILYPERLTRKDFLKAPNIEVRRVIGERMGQRFVPELGGVVLDSGPRGTLYEVRLPPDDPERVARYVQVQDASTERQYFLRVPPTIQTAAEAVAWSFQLTMEEYAPAHET